MTQATEIEAIEARTAQDSAGELELMLHGAGVFRLDGTGWIRATGEDRVRWLNGMVTNSIQELTPGDGNYSFALSAQGRIQGDLWAFLDDDGSLMLETARDRIEGLMTLLDRFIIMDDVELADVSAGRVGFGVAGPGAAGLLAGVGLRAGTAMRTKVDWRGAGVEVIAAYGPLVPRYEVWADDDTAAVLAEALGGVTAGAEAVEWLRILEGTPRYGVDIRDKELPQETAQGRALQFAKGCYLGQEIVERIRSRGNVHRGFAGFRLDGPLPAVGAVLEADGKAIGELTSVAAIPLDGAIVQYGLGYVRREAVERGAALRYATELGTGVAVPVALPVRGDGIAPGSSGITQD